MASSNSSDTNTTVINAALSGNISSDTQDDMAYAAAPIQHKSRVVAVIQLAAPLSAAQSLVWERWLALGGAVLAVTAVAGLAAFWLSTTLTRPLAQLQQAALQIAQGNFSQRLSETRQDEIGEVARAFNHMTGQVEAMIEEQRAFAICQQRLEIHAGQRPDHLGDSSQRRDHPPHHQRHRSGRRRR